MITSATQFLTALLRFGELATDEFVKADVEICGHALRRHRSTVELAEFAYSQLPVDDLRAFVRRVLFRHGGYRDYLVHVVALELARRGLEGGVASVEEILLGDLGVAVRDLNSALDHLEASLADKGLKDASSGDLVKAGEAVLASLKGKSGIDVEDWNRGLLGISGNHDGVCQAILAREALRLHGGPCRPRVQTTACAIVDLATALAMPAHRPVLFPWLQPEAPADWPPRPGPAWRKRPHVFSGIPLYDTLDESCDTPGTSEIQDAFCEHPIPWLLVQLGLLQDSGRNPASGIPPVRLVPVRDEAGWVEDIRIDRLGQPCGTFLTLLGDLLDTLGFRLVLPFGGVEDFALDRLLVAMTRAGMFDTGSEGELVLARDVLLSLSERPRYGRLNKGCRTYRERLLAALGSARGEVVVGAGGPGTPTQGNRQQGIRE